MGKAREFWIEADLGWLSVPPEDEHKDKFIHVIEKSAYDDLQNQLLKFAEVKLNPPMVVMPDGEMRYLKCHNCENLLVALEHALEEAHANRLYELVTHIKDVLPKDTNDRKREVLKGNESQIKGTPGPADAHLCSSEKPGHEGKS